MEETEASSVLERALEKAGLGTALIGAHRRFLRVSPRLCAILGYPEHELLQLTGREISHPEDREAIEAQRRRLYDGEIDAVRVEQRCLRRDRSVVWVSFTMVPELDAAGAPRYELAVYEDITARKRAEAALREGEARFRRTFEMAGAGLAHVDLQGRFMLVNPRLCDILGYSEAELIGRVVKDLSHPEDRDAADGQRARVFRGELETARLEKRYLRKDGSVVWTSVVIALERDAAGRPLYAISVLDDISERKRAEAALREAHEELKRSNAELEQFAYVASHDLQEPLRMVASYTQLLGRRYADRLDADAREFMGYIVDGAARMKRLIEDLLAYARLGTRARLPRSSVELGKPLAHALANLRTAIDESGAAVTHDPLPAVSADEAQIAQLFQNLIGNALKFRSSASPRIHVAAAERGAFVEVAVRDNGIGIEPQYFGRIFMVFQRLHGTDDYPGTGIGLAICKKVVERHGGEIRVESAPGAGSAFIFTLPRGIADGG